MTDAIGHRGVFGVLVPWFNTALEPELADLRPRGVSNQTARFALDANLVENVASAANGLAACRPTAILLGLSTESFPNGLGALEQGAGEVTLRTGLPVFTAPHATLAALRSLSILRIGVVTPFAEAANAHVRQAFEANGFEVLRISGLACPSIDTIGHSRAEDVRRIFEDVDDAAVEALVQVGTGLPVVHLVADLERSHGKPVVACNAALYWQALRSCGIEDPVPGFGRLLG